MLAFFRLQRIAKCLIAKTQKKIIVNYLHTQQATTDVPAGSVERHYQSQIIYVIPKHGPALNSLKLDVISI